jgi:hypothetical protein
VLYVVIGAGGLGATLLTRFESDLMRAARIASQRRPAILAVDAAPAVLAAVARDERGFILAGPDVWALIGAPYQAVGQGCCGGLTSAASLGPS